MEVLIQNSGRNDGYGECKHSWILLDIIGTGEISR